MTRLSRTNKRTVKLSTPEVVDAVDVAAAVAEGQTDIDDVSYRELQVMAKAAGLKASGSRAALIERLA